jgi:hypothetical protein
LTGARRPPTSEEPAETTPLWALWVPGLVAAVSAAVFLAIGSDPLWAMLIVLPTCLAIIVAVEVRSGRGRRRHAEHD